jgi:hypothetical protein
MFSGLQLGRKRLPNRISDICLLRKKLITAAGQLGNHTPFHDLTHCKGTKKRCKLLLSTLFFLCIDIEVDPKKSKIMSSQINGCPALKRMTSPKGKFCYP